MANKKKIFDIIPPKEIKEIPVPSEPQKEEKPAFLKKLLPSDKKSSPVSESKRKINKKLIWWPISICLGLISIGAVGYFLMKPEVEIEIWPVTDQVQFETQAIIDSSITQLLLNEENFLPGQLIEKEQTFSQEFSSTGQKSKSTKAQGTIRVYNAYSTLTQPLIAQTRFVSDGGKLFRTPKRIVVPGGHYEGGELIPGEIDIIVEAGEPGEEYNIGPSTFSVPGLAGTARYTKIYAKSFKPMTGGIEAEVFQVTQEDLDKAQGVLGNKALEDCQTSLVNSISQADYIIIEGALMREIIEMIPLAEAGQEVANFTFQAKTKAQSLTFKRVDLENFAKSYILKQISPGKDLVDGSLGISHLPEKVDLIEGRITLNIEMSAKTYSALDENSLKEKIKNKRVDEIRAVLRDIPEIDKAQTRLWPFWVSQAPTDIERIKINVILD